MEGSAAARLAASAGALARLKVIDLSRVLGGPFCTMVLADHGADVIKLEPPQGDETRDWGPPFDADGTASYFIGVNRNKHSVGLDLAKPEGREVLLALLAEADVLVENFKPGTMERWGLGYADLAPRFPGLVHCRISGFGADGPLGGMPGYDAILQAMTGLMSVNGEPASGSVRLGTPVVDLATGLFSALGIMMALFERARSGQGQFLDMTLHDCGLALLHPQAANFFLNGRRPVPLGNPHPNIAPYEKYRTRTCEIFLAIGNDGQFARLAHEIGRPELAQDPRFLTNAERLAHRPVLTEELAASFAKEDGHALAARLLAAGLPVGPVLAVDEAIAAPHTAHRAMVTALDGYRGLGTPIKLSRTPGGTRRKPPSFAADAETVLSQHGFAAERLAALRASGALPDKRRK
ncbi:MAG TPA: CoA transferase [Acetobacteraceae bacterium]|nr:CoA transferase [Acetobacteraceae bacterium]